MARRLAGPAGLTEHRSTFDRRHLIQAIADTARSGARTTELTAAAERVMAEPAFTATGAEHPLAGPVYSTVELLDLEATILETAQRRTATGTAVCDLRKLEWALADRPSLSEEQAEMVCRLCTSGDGVQVVIGRAGTGKTFALDAARAAWVDSGITVIGAALAARTAAGLQAGTGIASSTVDQILTDLARPGPNSVLPRRGALVVDEAGLVGTRKLAALLTAAEHARCAVILVGDPRQLPEVDAGGAFAALAARTPIELTVNRRQANQWERAALDQLRHGDIAQAVAVYRDRRRINLAPTAEAAHHQLVGDWWATHCSSNPDETVMLALHQGDVDDLNQLARTRLQAAGELAGPELETAGRAFAVGDEVLALRNDRRIGVTNGTRGRITGVDLEAGAVTVGTDTGKEIALPADYLQAGHLAHGYCLTVHKAQGLTVGHAFVLGSDRLYREAGYTGMSRATQRTDLYQVAPPPVAWQPAVDPYHTLGRSAAQTLASEQALGPGLADLRNQQQHRLAGLRDAALADTGAHLVERLGPPPPAGPAREAWAVAATAIDDYRDRYHLAGPDPLGPRPEQAEQLRRWEHAQVAAKQVDRHLDPALERGHGLDL